MKKIGFGVLICAFSLFGLMALNACSESKDDAAPASTTYSYGGPGSIWTASLSGNSFKLVKTDSSNTTTITGTYQTLTTGFLKLTVESASGPDAPTVGSVAYAVNVPGYVLLVKPIATSQKEIIPMVATGTCPSGTLDMNWVVTMDQNTITADSKHFGAAAWTGSASTLAIKPKYEYDGTVDSTGSLASGTCADGLFALNNPNQTYVWVTEAGGAIVGDTDSAGGPRQNILAIKKDTSVAVSDLAGDYAVLLFSGSTGNAAAPYAATITAGGSVTATEYSDVENGTTTGTPVTFTLAAHSEAGFFSGSVGTETIYCAADSNANGTGKKLLVCVGRDPGDSSQLYNVLMVSK